MRLLTACLGLALLTACASSPTGPTTTPPGTLATTDGARIASILACGNYLRSHPQSGPLVAQRLARVQHALDAGSTYEAIRSAALDSLADPRDAAVIEAVLIIVDRHVTVPGTVIAPGSPVAVEIQALIDGCRVGAAL